MPDVKTSAPFEEEAEQREQNGTLGILHNYTKDKES